MTDSEKQELKQEIITQIKSESQDVTELEEVQSLNGVNSLPAMRGAEMVIAPISLLGAPATAAANRHWKPRHKPRLQLKTQTRQS